MRDRIRLENQNMTAEFDAKGGGIVSLTSPYDNYKADFVLTPEEFPEYDTEDCRWLGNIGGSFQVAQKLYHFSSGVLKAQGKLTKRYNCIEMCYPGMTDDHGEKLLSLTSLFQMEKEELRWTVRLQNEFEKEMIFTDIHIPFLMNQFFRKDDDFKYDCCTLRHTCITDHSSYLYWEKSSANAPILLFAPVGDCGLIDLRQTQDDALFGQRFGEGYGYEGAVQAYVASEYSMIGSNVQKKICIQAGETKELQFVLTFLQSEQQIYKKLEALSLTVLKAFPGMVGPIDKDFYVMTRPLTAEVEVCGKEDQILGSEVRNGWNVSRIRFGAYGKRKIIVKSGENVAVYSFFITETVQDMIDKHAEFIAQNHLETDEKDPCYHALLMWDMVNKRRINSTFNPYYEDWWRGGSDDPGLASGLFLAEKNVYRAVESQVRVLNDYVEDFILQRLTEQPGWRVHRMVPWYTMFEPWAGRGADDVWRAFNYVHVINVMYDMYRIQRQHHYDYLRDACEYLKMAYEYTKAMFNYWMFPNGVGASEFGNMGEMTLPLYLSQALEQEGFVQEAAEMDAIFDKKAHYFNSRQFPFGSEMVYDSTAFEAVYGYGKRIHSDHIMRSAARASYSNRGKQPVWFLYNTDVRAGGDTGWNSSYMTQLGAYPILDYTLDQGHVDEDWILSYYGAFLSGWLIYNSGGYWNPEQENQGATGWITIASLINHTGQPPEFRSEKGKLGMPLSKGCVALSGEAGIGFFGALRTACSIVMEHSVLGRIGLGCTLEMAKETDERKEIIQLEDGLSVRFYYVPDRWKAETQGGYIREIKVTDKEIVIETISLCVEGVELKLLSIPQEGQIQEMLYEKHLPAKENERSLIRIPGTIIKS